VKTVLITFLLAASIVSAFSQTQERQLLDRVMKPDMELGNPLQNKAFSGESTLSAKTSPVASNEYPGLKDARVRDFTTRSFFGIKNPWFGGKVYKAEGADTWSKYVIPNAGREVPVKKAEAVGFYDEKKTAFFGSPVVPVQEFIPQPAAQGAVSRISDKINNKMTIDEVRELLNKPR